MKRPSFLEGVAVALAASVAGSLSYTALALVVPGGAALRVVIAGLSLAYLWYLLARSRQPVGRITTLMAWLAVAILAWLMEPALIVYLLVHLAAVWLVRSLYLYSSLFPALADLALNALSLAAALWALVHSGSLFLAIWCLFLVQALFVGIPTAVGLKTNRAQPGRDAEDRFERAHRAAESALRRLS